MQMNLWLIEKAFSTRAPLAEKVKGARCGEVYTKHCVYAAWVARLFLFATIRRQSRPIINLAWLLIKQFGAMPPFRPLNLLIVPTS